MKIMNFKVNDKLKSDFMKALEKLSKEAGYKVSAKSVFVEAMKKTIKENK